MTDGTLARGELALVAPNARKRPLDGTGEDRPVARTLPGGTVTFLFTDVEGSTRLLQQLGPDGYAAALAEHRRIVREAIAAHEGHEVDTQGDAFFVAFPTAPDALAAAGAITDELAEGPIRVRIGVHTGTPTLTGEGYVGVDVHRAARIAALGHGGQVLVSSTTSALVDRRGLRDLGLHRLKDLSEPERIHQLGAADFPPLRSLHQTNLPVPATSFLGRERELDDVVGLLGRDTIRLLTLTGPGGSGKTRLSIQAAAALADRYVGGVWWVPLANLRDAALVLDAAGRTLGASDGLADHIGDRSILLVLDNFEQVIDAAPDVAGLLGACPNLELLVTSRERLRVSGEHEYAVPPLAENESTGLFVERAQAGRPAFQPDAAVGEICARLDHLPLAIELAAARVRSLSTAQILARLEQRLPLLTGGGRDAPDRQRTLRGAIEWSHDLLTSDEQRLFARLAVFRGGWTLEAAETVAEADLDTLESLVDKSLVRQREGRFSMLETIREYAVERLEQSGEAASIRRAHAEAFLALAEEAEPHVRYDEVEWLDRLELENDNVRAALDRLEADGEWELVLRLAGALWRFWYLRSYLAEGRARLERALAAGPEQTAARGKALNGASVMLLNVGEPEAARRLAEEAREIHAAIGDAWAMAYSTMMVANGYFDADELERGGEWAEQALHRFEELGDDHYALMCASNLGSMYRAQGNIERGRELDESVLARARKVGNRRMESAALMGLASYAYRSGRAAEAIAPLAESTRINLELSDLLWLANNLRGFAVYLAAVGRHREGAIVLGTADVLQERMGVAMMPWAARERNEAEATLVSELGEAGFSAALAEGRSTSPDAAIALAEASG